MSHDKVKETGTDETHIGKESINKEEIITAPMKIRGFQTKAIHKINYEAI